MVVLKVVLNVLGVCVCACACMSVPACACVCAKQGPSTNVIRCRKDGNWTGSFKLCPQSKGQCSLPQNLNPSIRVSCKKGHGIGLYMHYVCDIVETIYYTLCLSEYRASLGTRVIPGLKVKLHSGTLT